MPFPVKNFGIRTYLPEATMIRLTTYYVRIREGRAEISTNRAENTSKCSDLFESLADILKKAGFELVYLSKTDHEEEAYRRGDSVVILLPKYCAVRTNLPKDELIKLVKSAERTYNYVM